MGRSPCCEKVGLKKGPWTPEEDQKLLAYIEQHGHGSWRSLPSKAGLERCGKSCRLRWTNYLRPDIKRGKFSLQEEQTIIQLHALLGNRWSAIATHLPKRTDNEIKNYWNTHLKKRLSKMGIDPVTHKPKNDALHATGGGDGQSKSAAKLSHLAQWESARLEAEARLVRESKLRSHSLNHDTGPSSSNYAPNFGHQFIAKMTSVAPTVIGIESPTSTLTFSEAAAPHIMTGDGEHSKQQMFEFVGMSLNQQAAGMVKEEGGGQDWNKTNNNRLPNFTTAMFQDDMSIHESDHNAEAIEAEGFTDLLLNSCGDPSLSDSDNGHHELENKNYWNNILNLVDSSPSDDHSPVF